MDIAATGLPHRSRFRLKYFDFDDVRKNLHSFVHLDCENRLIALQV